MLGFKSFDEMVCYNGMLLDFKSNKHIFWDSDTNSPNTPRALLLSCHRHNIVCDLPKDVFKFVASKILIHVTHHPEHALCDSWVLQSLSCYIHHIELVLCDLWVLWPLSCVWLPPPGTYIAWLLSSLIPFLCVSYVSLCYNVSQKGQIRHMLVMMGHVHPYEFAATHPCLPHDTW